MSAEIVLAVTIEVLAQIARSVEDCFAAAGGIGAGPSSRFRVEVAAIGEIRRALLSRRLLSGWRMGW